MRRKAITVIGILVGILGLIIILIWPMAPVWARLGAKPMCIQGSWPRLKLVPCEKAATSGLGITPSPLPTVRWETSIPIIVDDDGSPDGIIALLYFLRNPRYDVRAVTISSGEAHPDLFAPQVIQLLAGLGKADIPVGAGRATPLEGTNTFPDPWRKASDGFWELSLPQTSTTNKPGNAAKLIVETLNNSTFPFSNHNSISDISCPM